MARIKKGGRLAGEICNEHDLTPKSKPETSAGSPISLEEGLGLRRAVYIESYLGSPTSAGNRRTHTHTKHINLLSAGEEQQPISAGCRPGFASKNSKPISSHNTHSNSLTTDHARVLKVPEPRTANPEPANQSNSISASPTTTSALNLYRI